MAPLRWFSSTSRIALEYPRGSEPNRGVDRATPDLLYRLPCKQYWDGRVRRIERPPTVRVLPRETGNGTPQDFLFLRT
jgi:hypothetical protein